MKTYSLSSNKWDLLLMYLEICFIYLTSRRPDVNDCEFNSLLSQYGQTRFKKVRLVNHDSPRKIHFYHRIYQDMIIMALPGFHVESCGAIGVGYVINWDWDEPRKLGECPGFCPGPLEYPFFNQQNGGLEAATMDKLEDL